MALESAAVAMLVLDALPEYLGISGLARLQLTSSAALDALLPHQAWVRALDKELPFFTVDHALLEQPHRREVLELCPALAAAAIAEGVRVHVASHAELRGLSRVLRGAAGAAAMHLAGGGQVARVLVGRFAFEDGTASAAFVGGDGQAPQCNSNEQVFQVGNCLPRMLLPGSSGELLRVSLGLKGGCLFVRAGAAGAAGGSGASCTAPPPSSALPRPGGAGSMWLTGPSGRGGLGGRTGAPGLVLDITAANSSLMLHHRAVPVKAEGRFARSSSGICSARAGGAAVHEALLAGVLCVLCVREGSTQTKTATLAAALSLDKVRSL